jgi:hypothetical protein
MAKIIPVAFKAPAWNPDHHEYTILWHGCTAFDKDNIEKGIDLAHCAVDTDFGRGFYTTTLERQARQWAWDRYYDWQSRHPTITGNFPVVLRFRVRRFTKPSSTLVHEKGLDELLSMSFVRGDYHNEEFWSLVQHCRMSVPAEPAKGILEVVNHHQRPGTGWYQMVSGPVAAFWKQRNAMSDSDQFSFHEGGTHILDALISLGKGKGHLRRGDPDYYCWYVVY